MVRTSYMPKVEGQDPKVTATMTPEPTATPFIEVEVPSASSSIRSRR